jgi:hypothetical protein
MALFSVLAQSIEPERLGAFEESVRKLATRAAEKRERWTWTAHQTAIGELGTIYFVSEAQDWSELATRGSVLDLARRVLGDKEGERMLEVTRAAIRSAQQTVSVDRPDLSYLPEQRTTTAPFHMVTVVRVRPGGQEAFEEFLRKLAEAIPKVDDPARTQVRQTLVGDLREYRIARPLAGLGDLDRQLPAPELLLKAFGTAEGGLLFRTGQEAIEHVERRIVAYREDLSNPRS